MLIRYIRTYSQSLTVDPLFCHCHICKKRDKKKAALTAFFEKFRYFNKEKEKTLLDNLGPEILKVFHAFTDKNDIMNLSESDGILGKVSLFQ